MHQAAPEIASEAAPRHRGRLIVRALLILGLGLALMWGCVTQTYVAYLADSAPERALRIHDNAAAELSLVDRELSRRLQEEPANRSARTSPKVPLDPDAERFRALAEVGAKTQPAAQTPASPADAKRDADDATLLRRVREALATDPLSARGLRLLAQLSEAHEAKEEVANLMRMAVARNLHETQALYWLMATAANAGAYRDAISYADAILRTRSRLSEPAIQVMAMAAQSPEGLAEVRRTVLANPPWRQKFFGIFSRAVTDGRVPLQILLDLKATPYPPTSQEIAGYLDVLLQNRLFGLAYYAWLQFLPPGQLAMVTTPFNGSFELKPSGLPFDWMLPKGAGVTAEVVARASVANASALLVEFGIGRIDFAGVSQLILLSPGSYRFSAVWQGQVTGRRGLVWAVSCAGGKELARSQMMLGSAPAWTPVEFKFAVPEADCPAQQLRLFHDARTASEQLVTGKSFHDEVHVERLPN